MNCKHLQYNLEIFENNKCIFHCEKNDWFTLNNKNEKIWDKNKVSQFWIEIREYLAYRRKEEYKIIYFFKNIVFPNIDISLLSEVPIDKNKILLEDFYFWDKGSKLEINDYVSFENCKFNDLNFHDFKIEHLSFNDIKVDTISLLEMEIKNLFFQNINCKASIEVDTLKENDSFLFGEIEIDHLSIHDIEFENITIRDSHINSLYLSELTINKGFFINLTIEEVWSATGFNIGNKDKFSYLNVNVKKADREYFRSIKSYFFEKRDYIEANNMYKKEMDTYLYNTYKKFTQGNCENWFKNFDNLIIAAFGKYSSNFGQSCIFPFLWILFILFFNVFYINDFCLTFLLSEDIRLLDEMAQIVILKDINDFGIIDLIFKVLLGLFIYQLTIAMKRKTKY